MSDAYAKEFEKWLKESKSGSSSGENTEEEDNDKYNECYEESSDGSVSDMDELVIYEGDPPKSGISRRNGKIFQSCEKDSAPILVDDDDEDVIFSSPNERFEDEPPILEPVPKQLSGAKVSSRDVPKFSSQNSIRSYSRHDQTYTRKPMIQGQERSLKTYSFKDKAQPFLVETSRPSHSIKSKDSKESDNIFDKFNSMSSDHFEDTPPPLIPSPEAMHLSAESPVTNDKHQSHSPDFCAMEADSTSELSGNFIGNVVGSSSCRMSKTSTQGDVSIECDSTCMLGASPVIVSPASVSNGDMDEVRDPGGDGHADKELEMVGCKKHNVATEVETEKPTPNFSGDTLTVEKTVTDSSIQQDSLLSTETSALHLLTKDTTDDKLQTFPVAIKTELDYDSASGFPNEPPILSVISPTRRPRNQSRRKRHTIDSAETFSRSGKRPRTVPSPRDNDGQLLEHLPPPTLTHVSETVTACGTRSKKSNLGSQDSKRDICASFDRRKCSYRKSRRQRCNTLPFADLTEYSDFLPENLRSFVVTTAELSQLQTRMHTLLYHLFPQLRLELDAMSPESHRFEKLLRELVLSLEQPSDAAEAEESEQFQSKVQCKNTRNNSLNCSQQTTRVSSLEHSEIPTCMTFSMRHSAENSCLAVNPDQKVVDSTHPPKASSSVFTSHHQESDLVQGSFLQKDQLSKDGSKDSGSLSQQLSHLSLRDLEEHLVPVQVLVHRDPDILLDRFAQLTCSAMQLLLPDLAISLCNELAQSPHDLIVFIDNVILTNSKRKSKQ